MVGVFNIIQNKTKPLTIKDNIMPRKINICDECGRQYFSGTSPMASLCSTCAYILYGYPKYNHILNDKDKYSFRNKNLLIVIKNQ